MPTTCLQGKKTGRGLIFLALCAGLCNTLVAGDWPTWRYDARRSANSPEKIPTELQVKWHRQWPPLTPAYRSPRLQFDSGYEPIISGGLVFIASSFNDSVTALHLEDGSQAWRFHANGPVRFAPCAFDGKVYFGSDDGYLYCLQGRTGVLEWKFRAAPSNRRLLGNGRIISAWPIRGGPVIDDGKIYFAAGVWSFEGVFIYCLDAKTGSLSWLNDRGGYIYGPHPHGARAFGGISPQGYLVINGDELVVPCSAAYPARFDLATGRIKDFSLPGFSRVPGGWFAMADTAEGKAKRRGKVILDSRVNSEQHEDRPRSGPGTPGSASQVHIGGRIFSFGKGVEGIKGKVHSIAASGGKLLVTTREGGVYCLGSGSAKKTGAARKNSAAPALEAAVSKQAEVLLSETDQDTGYCIVTGKGAGALGEALALASRLQVTSFVEDPVKASAGQQRLDSLGLPRSRVSIIEAGAPLDSLPPYLANLVVVGNSRTPLGTRHEELLRKTYKLLRPFGGAAVFNLPAADTAKIRNAVKALKLHGSRVKTTSSGSFLLWRDGPLPGSTDYSGGWSSPDELVKAPLGVLWFDDSLGHFKRSPQPQFLSGIMISRPKNWHHPRSASAKNKDYPLLEAVLSDIYTGRILSPDENKPLRSQLGKTSSNQREPTQYRPPTQKDAWKPGKPRTGDRTSPLTGLKTPRSFPKSYGCDGGINYGHIYSMRSGTAAFYDLRSESGTIHISGPRSGCTNSVIPAGGLLNIPYFYEGCTCSYPLPVGLALVSMPQEHEQWASWGKSEPKDIIRLGINLGAPGDRMDSNGTLWLDHPSVGGPSPTVRISTTPTQANYHYHHSLRLEGGQGWPWVCASGATGLSNLKVEGLKPGKFTLRLYFAEFKKTKAGQRVFDVLADGKPLVNSLDIIAEAGGPRRCVVKEFPDLSIDGKLELSFNARKGKPLVCGLELVAQHLEAGDVPGFERKNAGHILVVPGQR
ncbi:MAG: PQQ-binding-like beta-propeller repeat protein [Planctomycetota bacterium]